MKKELTALVMTSLLATGLVTLQGMSIAAKVSNASGNAAIGLSDELTCADFGLGPGCTIFDPFGEEPLLIAPGVNLSDPKMERVALAVADYRAEPLDEKVRGGKGASNLIKEGLRADLPLDTIRRIFSIVWPLPCGDDFPDPTFPVPGPTFPDPDCPLSQPPWEDEWGCWKRLPFMETTLTLLETEDTCLEQIAPLLPPPARETAPAVPIRMPEAERPTATPTPERPTATPTPTPTPERAAAVPVPPDSVHGGSGATGSEAALRLASPSADR